MGVIQHEFQGIKTNIPGIYTKSEFPPSLGSVGADTNIVCVIGECKGGIPYNATGVDESERINVVESVGDAENLLVGGNGYYMTEFYLTPTKEENLANPSFCLVCRVNPAVVATAILEDVATDDVIDLATVRYGALANQISRKIEAGTNVGKKITIKFKGEVVVSKDDIASNYLTIQYVGAGTPAVMTINAISLATTITGAPTDNLTLLFTEYPTLEQLVAYINEQDNYTCTMDGKGDANTTTFDWVTAQDIKTSAYTASANVEAIIQFFNDESGGEVTAELHASAERDAIVNDSNFVFFTGGSEGTISNTHWAGALELLEKLSINHILVASGDAAIHAMVDAHLRKMSGIEEKKNRSAGAGASSSTTTFAARKAEMKALNAARFQYGCTPFYRYDRINANLKTEFEPFYLAAMDAGIRYGNHITLTSTFKTANVLGIKEEYKTSEKKAYIDAGGMLLERNERGITFVRSISTYQSENLILNIPSMLRTADSITLDSQAKLLTLIATLTKAPNSLAIKSIQNFIVTNMLPGFVEDGRLTEDPNTGAAPFSDIKFSLSGDRFDFSFTGIIVAPLEFVFIKQKFVITGSTQVAA